MEKSRASAREAVSSRWATRAESSTARMKQSLHGKTVPMKSTPSSTIVTVASTGSERDLIDNNNGSIVHATWRQIQHSLGWFVLQQLDQEGQKRRAATAASKSSNNNNNERNHKRNTKRRNETNVRNNNNANINPSASSSSSSCKKIVSPKPNKAKNAQMLANTLTQMRITTALQTHLESITNQDTNHQNNAYNKNYLKNIISILPAGFDETSALMNSIQHRKRAFFLLDFAQIIKSHAMFLSYTCGFEDQMTVTPSSSHNFLPPTHRLKRTVAGVNSIGKRRKGIYIQPQFSVTKNPNIELLKLLVRLGVDLRCNSSDDIMTATQALREEGRDRNNNDENDYGVDQWRNQDEDDYHGDQGMVLVDDASKTRKPNGYFRRLLQTRPGFEDLEVAVDDVDEVRRISRTIRQLAMRSSNNNQRMMKRSIDDNTATTNDPTTVDNEFGTNSNNSTKKSCRFMLRLPPIEGNDSNDGTEFESWERLILNVHNAAKEEGGELFGVSVDLSQWSQLLLSTDTLSAPTTPSNDISHVEEKRAEETTTVASNNMLYNICARLRLFRLLLLSVGQYHIRIDLTGLPTLSRTNCDTLTKSLSSIVSCAVTYDELKQVFISNNANEYCQKDGTAPVFGNIEEIIKLANDPVTCSLFYTADLSTHLVARAGALCARIIGSKVTAGEEDYADLLSPSSLPSSCTNDSSSTSSRDADKFGKGATSETISRKERTHYFIDDGCYGSLGSSCATSSSSSSCQSSNTPITQKHIPVHLYGNTPIPKSKSHISLALRSSRLKSSLNGSQSMDDFSPSSDYGLATIWGPTCDGLDKVCESVLLPKDLEANRDWLVFSNLGCGGFGGGLGLGTAFNGFDPPDVEYCVLGYFSAGS